MSEAKIHGYGNVDLEGVPRHSGDPRYGEEREERSLLGLTSCATKETKAVYPAKLKIGLRERVWSSTHKNRELLVTRLTELNVAGTDGPEHGKKTLGHSAVAQGMRESRSSPETPSLHGLLQANTESLENHLTTWRPHPETTGQQ